MVPTGITRAPRRSSALWGLSAALIAFGTCIAFGQDVSLASLRAVIAHEHPSVRWVTPRELDAELHGPADRRPRLFDARTVDEFAVSHLRGALRIDPDRPDFAAFGRDRSRPVVVYCSVGYRSAVVAEVLARASFTDVRNLEGGIFAWANAGKPVVRGDREVREVHPYDATWGRMLRAELRSTRAR